MGQVRPGDVLAVRSGGWAGTMIRLGAALADKPNISNHIAVIDHSDAHGTLWCLEGRPSGAGWRDARAYLASSWTLDNAAQPKTDAQRAAVCKIMQSLIGTQYSWAAIAADALAALGVRMPGWDPSWHGTVPAHVVCSSLAAYAYTKAGLACPAGEQGVTPGDWCQFILTRGWVIVP